MKDNISEVVPYNHSAYSTYLLYITQVKVVIGSEY